MDRSVSVTSRLALALASLRKGQYQEASDAARGEGPGSNFTYWSLVSAIHGKAGRLEEGRLAADELLRLYPDFADWAWKEMAARNKIGKAACRARVWQYVLISVVAVSLRKKTHNKFNYKNITESAEIQ